MSTKQLLTPESSRLEKTTLTKSDFVLILLRKFNQLPEGERKFFSYGSCFLGINSAFAGLIANSFFRRVLNVTQARFASGLPMAVLPLLTTIAVYNGAVSNPLITGDLNCAICAAVRGALTGAIVGGLYPILLAIPVNAGLATRYCTAPMPEKGNVLRFWMTVSKPVMKKMSYVLILQAGFGAYMSSRHHTIYVKMLSLPDSQNDVEELKD